jgi:hypothetical protein
VLRRIYRCCFPVLHKFSGLDGSKPSDCGLLCCDTIWSSKLITNFSDEMVPPCLGSKCVSFLHFESNLLQITGALKNGSCSYSANLFSEDKQRFRVHTKVKYEIVSSSCKHTWSGRLGCPGDSTGTCWYPCL